MNKYLRLLFAILWFVFLAYWSLAKAKDVYIWISMFFGFIALIDYLIYCRNNKEMWDIRKEEEIEDEI